MSESLAAVVRIVDGLLGWSLVLLPRDVTLVGLALLTVSLMLAARKFLTDQDLLRRCRADLVRLKQMRRAAKGRGDRDALQRVSRTMVQVQWMQLQADLRVLAVSIVPLAALATWAVERLEYMPTRPGDRVTLTARFPLSSVSRVTHLVPPAEESGDKLESPALQSVALNASDERRGVARWTVRTGTRGPARHVMLVVRHQGESVAHEIEVGTGRYAAPLRTHDGDRQIETEVDLRPYRFLNIVPGLAWLGLPPWMVAYLLLTLAIMPLAKRVCRIS